MIYMLIIVNWNYLSWSLCLWFLMIVFGILFVDWIELFMVQVNMVFLVFLLMVKVLVFIDGDCMIYDLLVIVFYFDDCHEGIWFVGFDVCVWV